MGEDGQEYHWVPANQSPESVRSSIMILMSTQTSVILKELLTLGLLRGIKLLPNGTRLLSSVKKLRERRQNWTKLSGLKRRHIKKLQVY